MGERVWLITGASSGFGFAIAEAALGRGDSVAATSRRVEAIELDEGERVARIPLDVTDPEQRSAAVDAAIERFGRIDVLVNNAGRTQVGAVEETTDGELRDLFELHFFAPVEGGGGDPDRPRRRPAAASARPRRRCDREHPRPP
jgi:NAD(P)-dependent dehydrogenase (short-subunit alcohol dehydrogenase family)